MAKTYDWMPVPRHQACRSNRCTQTSELTFVTWPPPPHEPSRGRVGCRGVEPGGALPKVPRRGQYWPHQAGRPPHLGRI
eukprot:1287147-Pyramimonas_sp.AAC.1